MNRIKKSVFLICCFVFFPFLIECAQAQSEKLFHFEVSGHELAKGYFYDGLKMLHAMEYEQAADQFTMAQVFDPEFSMAYWGEAMCYHHFLYDHHNQEKGITALYKLAGTKEKRIEKAALPHEKALMLATENLFEVNYTKFERDTAFFNSIQNASEKFQENEEILTFYALSVLVSSSCGTSSDAISLLEKVTELNPMHPGANSLLLIEYTNNKQFDKVDPIVATLNKVAGDLSTINGLYSDYYQKMGNWSTSKKYSEKAFAIRDKWVTKERKSLDDRDYLSLLQTQLDNTQLGKYEKAHSIARDINRDARMSKSTYMRYVLALSKGIYLSNTNKWDSEISEIEIPTNKLTVDIKNLCFFVDGYSNVVKGDLQKASWYSSQAIDQLTIETNRKKSESEYYGRNGGKIPADDYHKNEVTEVAEIYANMLAAAILFAEEKIAEAEELLKDAEALEAKICISGKQWQILKPVHEFHGELLLGKGDYAKGVDHFRKSLEKYPNRTTSLIGIYTCFKKLGDQENSKLWYAKLQKNLETADLQVIGAIK